MSLPLNAEVESYLRKSVHALKVAKSCMNSDSLLMPRAKPTMPCFILPRRSSKHTISSCAGIPL